MNTEQSYAPYKVVEENDNFLRLKLSKTTYYLQIIGLRILPLTFPFLFFWLYFETLNEMAVWIFILFMILVCLGVFWLLKYKIVVEIIFKNFSFVRVYHSFFSTKEDTIQFSNQYKVEAHERHAESNSVWVFYLNSGDQKQQLFQSSESFDGDTESRDNFIHAIKKYCGLSVFVK